MDANAKKSGTTYNIKSKVGETPEGKAIWKSHGTVFIRTDGSGGAAFVGEGDAKKTFQLFPKHRAAKRDSAGNPPAATAQVAAAPASAGAWGA